MTSQTLVNIDITNYGSFVITLDDARAPKTVKNFLQYVQEKFYDQTIFHRVINNFMIQGGGFEVGMTQKKKLHPAIENESTNGLKNLKYTVAMARTAEPHSATAQFFINVVDNHSLDHTGQMGTGWGYAVFGLVTEGMDIIDKIKAVHTQKKGYHENVPVEDVIIQAAKVVV